MTTEATTYDKKFNAQRGAQRAGLMAAARLLAAHPAAAAMSTTCTGTASLPARRLTRLPPPQRSFSKQVAQTKSIWFQTSRPQPVAPPKAGRQLLRTGGVLPLP